MSQAENCASFLQTVLEKMGLEAEVVSSENEERILLEVKGPETGLVIGKQGQTLDALQYLVNKVNGSKDESDSSKPVHLDAEGYRERRAESLVELAHRLAEKARRTGRPVAANPMSPADRRVIHVALAEMEGLSTHSEGEGIYRHLVVVPIGGAPARDGDSD